VADDADLEALKAGLLGLGKKIDSPKDPTAPYLEKLLQNRTAPRVFAIRGEVSTSNRNKLKLPHLA
jgi:hypothetical protein